MQTIAKLGIDLAKTVFVLHGVDSSGKALFKQTMSREQLKQFISRLPPCEVGMESGNGSHHWARLARKCGHTAKMIAPQFVAPFRKSGKNDANDAEAIVEAMSRPSMRFVAIKEPFHVDLQMLHRVRERNVHEKTALCCQIRAYLAEFGITVRKTPAPLRKLLPELISDENNEFTPMARSLLRFMHVELDAIMFNLEQLDENLERIAKQDDRCLRLMKMEGIGATTATALIASIPNIQEFKNGRQFAAFLGLTPKQYSSGGKTRLGGITKHGNSYLRKLLIHGARSATRLAQDTSTDKRMLWFKNLKDKKGYAKAATAFANKNARIIWALLARGEDYKHQQVA